MMLSHYLSIIRLLLCVLIVTLLGSDYVAANEIDDLKKRFERAALTSPGSVDAGKKLFEQATGTMCSKCHVVAGQGGAIGPNLSSIGGKFDRIHLIESILEPSTQIVEGFRTTNILTNDDKVLVGVVKPVDDNNIDIGLADGKIERLAVADIAQQKPSTVSIMPDALWKDLSESQFTDLIAYLESLRENAANNYGNQVSGPVALPDGFEIRRVATGISGGTAIEVMPDGRVLVCEQPGTLRLIVDDQLLPDPILKLPVELNWERGLIGVTVDPSFADNGFVYVCWVAKEPYTHHRISRFTMSGNVIDPSTERLLLEGDDQSKMGGNVPAGHQGGALHFGPDGKLYIALGEQTSGSPAQKLDTLLGKILRINADGSIPDDNPFLKQTTGKYQSIWAYGLRNTFTFAFEPGTSRPWLNDVGGNFEEINIGEAGKNYGWPVIEHGPVTDDRYVGPVHWYPQASISGSDFTPSSWPVAWQNKYLFADFVHGWIKAIDKVNPTEAIPFASGLRRPVDMRFDKDGSLYVLLRNAWVVDSKFEGSTGSLMKITAKVH
jgi:putative heme-binding domain-containing protein